jgi:tetratricopeptide (TPR) repeat protein
MGSSRTFDETWSLLTTIIALGTRLRFVLIECENDETRDTLRAKLEAYCEGEGRAFSTPNPGTDLLGWLTDRQGDLKSKSAVLFFPVPTGSEETFVLYRLNENRDNLRRDLRGVVILAGLRDFLSRVPSDAPDLWSVREKQFEVTARDLRDRQKTVAQPLVLLHSGDVHITGGDVQITNIGTSAASRTKPEAATLILPRAALENDTLQAVYEAAVAAGFLAFRRDMLLVGLSPTFVAMLPSQPSPSRQALSDLEVLNRAGVLPDGTMPLRIWLTTAAQFPGPQSCTEVFDRALRELLPTVLLSFAYQDTKVANELREQLAVRGIPSLALQDDGAADAAPLPENEFLIVALSPEWVHSRWPDFEKQLRAAENRGTAPKLLPLLVRDCVPPEPLRRLRSIDWRSDISRARELPQLLATLEGQPKTRNLSVPDATAGDIASVGATRTHDIFVGREAELAALEAALLPERDVASGVAVVALQGMPGVGKSYLADHFAYLHQDRFPGGYVKLALNADETRSVNELGSALAMQIDIPWESESTWERMRVKLLGPRALLHIENADAETSARATVALVKRLDGCAVIVSGRYQGLGAGIWTQIVIDTLDEETSIELLQEEAGANGALALEDKKKLARELGNLPLALHLAAGHLRAGVSVDLFLRRLRDWKNLLGIEPRNLLLDKADKRVILRSTFALSLELLKKAFGENAETWMQSFAMLGHAPASGVGRSLGAAMARLSEADFEDLMDRAVQSSLATRGATRKITWSVHPLLGELLRQSVGDDAHWLRGMTGWFLDRLPQLPYERHEEQGRLWKEIGQEGDALVSWLEHVPLEEAMMVARTCQSYAIQNGPFLVWMSFCERVLATTKDLDVQSDALWTLCIVAGRAGLNDRALTAAQSMTQVAKARGDDRGIALAAGAIGDIFQARGDFDEALRIRRDEQLPVYERLGDVRARAVTMGKIGDIFQARGDLDEALRIRRDEELPVYERLGDVRSRAITMGKIGDIFQARGDLDEALRIRRDEELPVYERLGDVRSRAVTMGQIGDIFQARGDLDEALRIRRDEQLPIYERLGDVRERAVTMGKIGDIFQARGDLDEALRIRRDEELPVYERLGDVRSLLVGRANLAQLLLSRSRPEDRTEAADLLRLALRDADAMGIPEAGTIRDIQRHNNLA